MDSTSEVENETDAEHEHETATPTRDVVRAGLALTDQVVVSATNFLTLAIVANVCDQSEVGVFHLAWTIVGFLRTAQERMISAPYFVFAHQPGSKTRSLLGSSLVHQSAFALLSGGIVLALGAWFHHTGQLAGMSLILLVLAASIPFILLRDHVRAVCAAHFRYPVALFVDVCVCLVQIGGILVAARLGQLTIPVVAALLGIACFIPTIAWMILQRGSYRIESSDVVADWKRNWEYSRWLVAARTIGIGGYFAIPWIVWFILGESSAGVFATTSGLVGLSLMFISGTNNFFQPRTIKAYHDHGVSRMVRTVIESIVVIGAVLLLSVAMFAVAGGWLLGIIYGESYAPYGSVVLWLSISMLTVSVSTCCGNGLAALAKPKGYFWGELAYCVVSVAVAFLCTPVWGLNGAALALVAGGLAASVVAATTLLYLVRQEQRVEHSGVSV